MPLRFMANHQDNAGRRTQGEAWTTVRGPITEHPGLGAVVGNLMLDAIDLITDARGMEGGMERRGALVKPRLNGNDDSDLGAGLERRQPLCGRG